MTNKNMTKENDTSNKSNANSQNSQNNNSGRQGFAAMDEAQQREIASKGGRSQGKESNPGNFANDPQRAKEAGKKGGSS